jgi:hypothetical protein
LVFRNDPVESRLHIDANVGVCVLIDRQARRGVLEKHTQQADLDAFDLWYRIENLTRNEVKAPSVGANTD